MNELQSLNYGTVNDEEDSDEPIRVPNPIYFAYSILAGYVGLFIFLVIARDLSLSEHIVIIGFIVAFGFIFSCAAVMASYLPKPKPTRIFVNCQICRKPIKWWQRKVLLSTSSTIGASRAERAWYSHRKCKSSSIYFEDTPDIMMNTRVLEKVWSHRDEMPFETYSKLCEEVSDTKVSCGETKLGRVKHLGT